MNPNGPGSGKSWYQHREDSGEHRMMLSSESNTTLLRLATNFTNFAKFLTQCIADFALREHIQFGGSPSGNTFSL